MTDDELERRLTSHYRAIDPASAPGDLGRRIEDALDRRSSRALFTARTRPALAAILAAVLIVAIGLGLRPGGFLSSPGTSPTPIASLQPSPSLASNPPSSTPSATVPFPSGSLPPISNLPWTGLSLTALDGGPGFASSVVTWSGGYLALGILTDQAPLPAWVSRDGRAWSELPTGGFGRPASVLAAPCADSVLVATVSPTGQSTVWRSTDGGTWTPGASPQLRVARDGDMAGNQTGAVAILADSPSGIAFSADCVTWQTVSIPASSGFNVQAVAAFGTGFVAVGDTWTATQTPVAWRSTDGRNWTMAVVQAHPDDGLFGVHSGQSGLVAESTTGDVPGLASFWTSPDGRTWKVSAADPLGVVQDGEGVGSANGLFSGDGTRLLGYGNRAFGQPTEYWISSDGIHWIKLGLSGDAAAALAGQSDAFLMRDGVFFSGNGEAWFGVASP
jgi:hypothetical protein